MRLSYSTPEDLRELILSELRRIETLLASESKESYRQAHRAAVQFNLEQNRDWSETAFSKYSNFFADGAELVPLEINPVLVEVRENWHRDLFRLARLTWSLPYSRGYGRRLRFLIMDQAHNKLIGIVGLQSPPLDFSARDRLFRYPPGRKIEFVNQTMDIFTLGAIPPYNRLLGGKLVALSAASNEVRLTYKHRYEGKRTEMEDVILPSDLVALTTTSAFGRSSIYDRLKFQDRHIAYSIGYTEGYGSFHLIPLYPLVCEYLKQQNVMPRTGFGVGPRAVWQTCKIAFRMLGVPTNSLKHGIKREAFLFPLINNLQEYLEGHDDKPHYYHQPFAELANWWRERWLIPRIARVDGWHTWNKDNIRKMLLETEVYDQ